jgi:hypothetical protein
MRRALVFTTLLIGAMSAGHVVAQTAGVVQFVAGDVKVVRQGGAEREARKGVPVSVGDSLLTPADGLAQLKMGDGGIIVVQPQSRLTIAEFHYDGAEDGTEKVHYRLEHGGFRAVTGAIGRTHKKNYVIETPIAHMGVRGTDHESYYFPVTGPANPDGAKPGAYNKVNTGKTFIRTDAGEVEVEPNQVGFVAGSGDVPSILPSVPGFFNRSIAPRSARPSADPTPDGVQVTAAKFKQDVKSADGESLVKGRGKPIMAGTGDGKLSAFSTKNGNGPNATTFGHSGNGMTIIEGGATPGNIGQVTLSAAAGGGTVDWSTWLGGSPTVNGMVTQGGVHVISTTNPTTDLVAVGKTMASATYSYKQNLGYSVASSGTGAPATLQSLDVLVNFTTQHVDSYVLQASQSASQWNASGSGSVAAFTGTSGIALTGSCSNCSGNTNGTASGTAHGTFVGSQAEGLITSFGLSASGKSLSGAAYLTR